MRNSRTSNVVRNMWVGTFFQVLSLFLGFVSRTIFIRILGSEYLGLNSLFTNVLTILSFAELGIGNAIVFSMYKPLADEDTDKLKKLINFYKKTYTIIGFIILVVGILIIPFIPSIINDTPNIKENIYLIYLLFLTDTAISYFFSYRTSIISADQKNYIVVMYTYIFKICQIILQLILLYFTKEYMLYLILQVITTFLTNLYLSNKSKKMYPFLKELGNNQLEKKETKKIFDNVKALFIYKLGSVVLNGTDSIIISKYLGLIVLGLYSNYYLLVSAITQILSQLFNAFTSSIGNLIAKETREKAKNVFNQLYYFTIFIYAVVCICLYLLFNDFITLWLGKEYLLSNFVVLTIVGHLYVNGVQFAGFTFRNASGNFKQFKYSPIFSAVLNIVISIILAKYIGLAGVFIGTIISRVCTSTWIDPYIIYKNVFKENVREYFIKYIKYLIIVIICFIPCYYISKLITVTNIALFILKGIILVILSSFMFLLFTFRTKEFNDIKNIIINFLKSKKLIKKNSNKKKIIFLTYNLDIGGIERAILNYVKFIDKDKYDVYLMLEKKEGIYLNEIPSNIKVINYNICRSKNIIYRKFINFLKIIYFSLRYYHKFDFSACFATSVKSCAILAKRFSKNNAIWFHGEFWHNNTEANKFLKYVKADKYKKIVFVSNRLKKIYLNARPNTKQKLYVINNLVNYNEMLENSKKKINLKHEKTTFLNVGRHEDCAKKLSVLLKISSKLLNDGYDFDLWLVGDGPDHQLYVDLVKKLKITNNVKFFGKQNNVFPYYRLCDCVLLSSCTEGNPVVFLETKVMNKPIISTDVSDAKIELDGYGIVTDINEDSYYKAMKNFLENGYKIKKKFDPEKYNNDILKKLYKVIDK